MFPFTHVSKPPIFDTIKTAIGMVSVCMYTLKKMAWQMHIARRNNAVVSSNETDFKNRAAIRNSQQKSTNPTYKWK